MRRISRAAVALAAVTALAACGGGGDRGRTAQADPYAHTRDPSCYTVDLFTDITIEKPSEAVPAQWRAFSGRWGGGKWGGEWCHDLYVLSIQPDGAVQVVETYAPHEGWGKRATAYTRRATLGGDGRLRMRYGSTELVYWIENGVMYGRRVERGSRPLPIAMERRSA